MLSRLVRSVLMWLLAVALPIQGASAVTMLACGPVHSSVAAAVSGVMPAAADHDHAAHLLDIAADHAAPAEEASSAANGYGEVGPGTAQSLHKASKGKCSACASCCSAAFLPTEVVAVRLPAATQFVSPLLPAWVAVFQTDGPDRPPRLILA